MIVFYNLSLDFKYIFVIKPFKYNLKNRMYNIFTSNVMCDISSTENGSDCGLCHNSQVAIAWKGLILPWALLGAIVRVARN